VTFADASLVKGMLARVDRQHDIAAWFGVNSDRIIDVKHGKLHPTAPVASAADLPPPGPYLSGRAAHTATQALQLAKAASTPPRQQLMPPCEKSAKRSSERR
jgi:hypothetical protein